LERLVPRAPRENRASQVKLDCTERRGVRVRKGPLVALDPAEGLAAQAFVASRDRTGCAVQWGRAERGECRATQALRVPLAKR